MHLFTTHDRDQPYQMEKKDLEESKRSDPSHPTSYFETLVHIVKGNIGPGLFAMGCAMKYSGVILGPLLTVIVGLICVYNNHVLVHCSVHLVRHLNLASSINFHETVEMCFENGPTIFVKWKSPMRFIVKTFVIVSQLGFCSVYFVFVASSLKDVANYYGNTVDVRVFILAMLVLELCIGQISSLKFISIVSLISNVLIISSVFSTYYLVSFDIHGVTSEKIEPDYIHLPLFLGTVIYAYEGINLILPLRNEMKNPKIFTSPAGPLNIGLLIATFFLISLGVLGYLAFGQDVKDSIAQNLSTGDGLGLTVKLALAAGVILTYPLQFYVANNHVWDEVSATVQWVRTSRWGPVLVRVALILLTATLAASVPELSLFISLIGALTCIPLSLICPALCELALHFAPSLKLRRSRSVSKLALDYTSVVFGIAGTVFGTYSSLNQIIVALENDYR